MTAAVDESLLPAPRISDPMAARPIEGTWRGGLAARLIHDPRDFVFVELAATSTLVLLPFVIFFYVADPFPWWLAPVYFVINFLGFLDRYNLMLHNTSHRPLFKGPFRVLNGYIPNVLGFFFGHTPNTYFGHHMGMHHPENNLAEDLSTTMPFQRDSVVHFARYFLRFFFLTWIELPLYLWGKGRRRLAVRTFFGELSGYAFMALMALVDWRATLVAFVVPFVTIRLLMMIGNWGQHAFVDGSDPANPHKNSITCINTRYNRRCFNDGYHIGHHVKANRHWTELPGDFLANLDGYGRQGAVVFEGIDFFQVSMMLFFGRYEGLARRMVDLPGGPRTIAEKVAFLKARLTPIAS